MKASNIIITGICLLCLGYGLYEKYFAGAAEAYKRVNLVKAGMSRQQVIAALAVPDSTYTWHSGSDTTVLQYRLNPGDSGTLRVFLRHDTVTAVKFHL